MSLRVQGNRLVNQSGSPVQLRGVNYSGFESVAVQGWNPTDPSGGQAGQRGGPNWAAVKSWHANAVRIPLNEASWLGYNCVDTDGISHNPDPGGNYQAAVRGQVAQAVAQGLYVILDLHWAAPGDTCPMLQTQMADTDHSLAFWKSVAAEFKNNTAVAFELYNEPYMEGLASGESPWTVLMHGGTLTYYPATSNAGHYRTISTSWNAASMQAMLDAVRSTGATNVVLVCGLAYCNDMSAWLANQPTDPLGQLAAAWHPYPPVQYVASVQAAAGGGGYAAGDIVTLPQPNTVYAPAVLRVSAVDSKGAVGGLTIQESGAYLQTRLPAGPVVQASTSGKGQGAAFSLSFSNKSSTWSMPQNWSVVDAIAARVPVVITETGEHNAPGTVGAPFLEQLLPYADAHGWSVLGWTWDIWGYADNVLITDVSGTPTAGYGQVFHDWMQGTAWQ